MRASITRTAAEKCRVLGFFSGFEAQQYARTEEAHRMTGNARQCFYWGALQATLRGVPHEDATKRISSRILTPDAYHNGHYLNHQAKLGYQNLAWQ